MKLADAKKKRQIARQFRQDIKERLTTFVETYDIHGNEQLDEIMHWANDCGNQLTYLLRQQYFHNSKKFKQDIRHSKRKGNKKKVKFGSSYTTTELVKIIRKQSAQGQNTLYKDCKTTALLGNLVQNKKHEWTSYYHAKSDFKEHPYKYLRVPRIPGYSHTGHRHAVEFNNQACSLKHGYLWISCVKLKIPISENMRAIVENDCNDPWIAKLDYHKRLCNAWLVPITGGARICAAYLAPKQPLTKYKGKPVSPRIDEIKVAVDPGVNNIMTLTTNNVDFLPLIINGRGMKSVNQYANKRIAHLQQVATMYKQKPIIIHKKDGTTQTNYRPGFQYFKTLQWRDNKLMVAIHKVTDRIVEYAIDCGASEIVVGRNKYWKQNSKLKKQTKQNFLYLPHYKVVQILKYKAARYGINVTTVPEAYTSQTSYLDNEKPVWKNGDTHRSNRHISPAKRRKKRGKYVTNSGIIINADVNGSLQIGHKKYPELFNIQVSRNSHNEIVTRKRVVGCVLHPQKWTLHF